MKRINFFFVLWLCVSSFTFAQTSQSVLDAVVNEMMDFTNGCGPGWLYDGGIKALNYLSGNSNACDNHDWDYYTLGMSKEEADDRFFYALRIDEWSVYNAVIANVFWAAVHNYGSSSYSSAQMESREAFRRIHHGNEWESYGAIWRPWDGHVQMSFPQCDMNCFH